MTLNFQYGNRWRQLGGLFVPEALSEELVYFLEERDRQLEDHLTNLVGFVPQTTIIKRTSALSISNDTLGTVNMNSTEVDQLGTANLTGDYISAPVDGIYLCTLSVHWTENITGARFVFIGGTNSGGGNLAGQNFAASLPVTNATYQNLSWVGPMSASGTFDAQVLQQSGISINLLGAWLSVTLLAET